MGKSNSCPFKLSWLGLVHFPIPKLPERTKFHIKFLMNEWKGCKKVMQSIVKYSKKGVIPYTFYKDII